MSRGQNPLVLMMALSLPSTASAIGLGEIHVDSALNEPLTAEIDIVGATEEDLAGITARVANKENFARLNADRPAFLATTSFKVAHNSRGRPVLAIRSTESFIEPLVDLVVDLRWHNGELIRQYSLLLDPAGFPTATRVASALPTSTMQSPVALTVSSNMAMAAAATTPAASPVTATSQSAPVPAAGVSTTRKLTHVKVGAKATLRGIAWRVGARSESDLTTLMYAIFQKNTAAFDGNINRLHRGAVLTIPSAEELAAVSRTDAGHAIHAQMAAWREATHYTQSSTNRASSPSAAVQTARGGTEQSATAAVTDAPNAPTAVAVTAPATPAPQTTAVPDKAASAELNQRVQSLEKNLSDMQVLFDREHDKMLGMQAQLTYAEKASNAPGAIQPAAATSTSTHRGLGELIGAYLVLVGAFSTFFYWQRRRTAKRGELPLAINPMPVEDPKPAAEPIPEVALPVAPRPAVIWIPEKPQPVLGPQPVAGKLTDEQPSLASRILDDIDIASLESSYMEEAASTAEIAALADPILNGSNLEDTIAEETITEDDMVDTVTLTTASVTDATLPAATVIVPKAPIAHDAAPVSTVVVDTTKLDYNLVDLDLTAQHVQMPSGLHEQSVVKERRTNLVDVLKVAIDREPDRRDLRMKLLETYYAAAATNRQGFLEAVQKFARERDYLVDGEWEKIAFMGRQIAGDTDLFAEPASDKDDLADCA